MSLLEEVPVFTASVKDQLPDMNTSGDVHRLRLLARGSGCHGPDMDAITELKNVLTLKAVSSKNIGLAEILETEFGVIIDTNAMKEMREVKDSRIQECDNAVEAARKTYGDIEIRDLLLVKASLLLTVWDGQKAEQTLNEALEITVGAGARIDNLMIQLRVSFFHGDLSKSKLCIDQITTELSSGGDWERRNKLKIYQSLYYMALRNFNAASHTFVETLSTFTAVEMLSFEKYISYVIITTIISMKRKDVMKNVMKSSEVLSVIEKLPVLKDLTTALYNCEYSLFLPSLAKLVSSLKEDRYLSPHAGFICRTIRGIGYKQFLTPYKTVVLSKMAASFRVPTTFLDRELSIFIASGYIRCQINRVDGLVTSETRNGKQHDYEKIMKMGDSIFSRIQNLAQIMDV